MDTYYCTHCGAMLVWGINWWEPCCDHQDPRRAPVHYQVGEPWEPPACGIATWWNATTNPARVDCPDCRWQLDHPGETPPITPPFTYAAVLNVRRCGRVPLFDAETGESIPPEKRRQCARALLAAGLVSETDPGLRLTLRLTLQGTRYLRTGG